MVLSRARSWIAAAVLAGGIAGGPRAAASPAAGAPGLPGAGAVSGPDLECFDTPGPPLHLQLHVSQLDPGLTRLGLPAHSVVVRELVQTCVPVAKDGISPGPAALPWSARTDLACYRIEAAPLPGPAPLSLEHVNPVLATLPGHGAVLSEAVELCLPVVHGGAEPPADVRRLIQDLALECYAVASGAHPVFRVGVTELDPRLAGIPAHAMTLASQRRQLCVPVGKTRRTIPSDVLAVVRSIAFEKLAASSTIAVPVRDAVLQHLHPLLTTLPPVPVTLRRASGLMVPVAMAPAP